MSAKMYVTIVNLDFLRGAATERKEINYLFGRPRSQRKLKPGAQNHYNFTLFLMMTVKAKLSV
jgi:hypothetical protein